VLAQTHTHLELIISDNASTDGTQQICQSFARRDRRVLYQRHPTNVGLLNNFTSAAQRANGTFVRWIGDDDWLASDFVSRVLDAFAEDPRRIAVSTQVVYRDPDGVETLNLGYDPERLASGDPVERLAAMLRLLTTHYSMIDPVYSTIRRDAAAVPRRNILREDQVFAARLALAGPWGHVAAPLAGRRRVQGTAPQHARLLGIPGWHRHIRVLLQCRELAHWVSRSSLDATQRRAAQAEILRFYLRSKQITARRGVAKVERLAGLPRAISATGAR